MENVMNNVMKLIMAAGFGLFSLQAQATIMLSPGDCDDFGGLVGCDSGPDNGTAATQI